MLIPRLHRAVSCAALSAALIPLGALAAPIGKIDFVSGAVSVQRADGATRLVGAGSAVDSGDTVHTAQDAEAVLVLEDGQRVYLKPKTIFRIDNFRFVQAKPQESRSFSSLLQGGLRVVSGLIGKQGNQENYQVKTKTATIGIRGTEYSATECAADCGQLPDGLHVAVHDGRVLVTNRSGSVEVGAGFGTIVVDANIPLLRVPIGNVRQVEPSPEACQ